MQRTHLGCQYNCRKKGVTRDHTVRSG